MAGQCRALTSGIALRLRHELLETAGGGRRNAVAADADPRIYREACRRLASPPESTLFVAGSAYDAEGASASGLQAVLVARRPDDRARHGATRIAASLHEIVADLQPSA
jgi:phosphoglycolate phosphatase-like HAD superfamily hydrolase